MKILIASYLCCALVPISALLGSKPQEKWYQNREEKNLDDLSNEVGKSLVQNKSTYIVQLTK